MNNEVTVTIKGWAGNDAKVRVGANGGRTTSFRVGVTPRYFSRVDGEHRDAPTQWFTVKAWGELGENVGECVHRGVPVLVRGRLVTDTWTTEQGTERITNVVHAESVGVELGKGTVRYTKVQRSGAQADAGERADEGVDTTASGGGQAPMDDPWDVEPDGSYGEEGADETLEPAG